MKNLRYLVLFYLSTFTVISVSAEPATQSQANNATIEIGTSNTQLDKQNQPVNNNSQSEQTTQNEQSGYSQGSVTRSIFTTEITGHEPIDKIEKLQSSTRSVYYFTELSDMSGQTAIHRWEFNGNIMAETKFEIAGPRWRVWSSKNLMPAWTGEWKVSVLNGVGDVISEDIFNYINEENVPVVQQQSSPAIQQTKTSTENSYNNDKLDQ